MNDKAYFRAEKNKKRYRSVLGEVIERLDMLGYPDYFISDIKSIADIISRLPTAEFDDINEEE